MWLSTVVLAVCICLSVQAGGSRLLGGWSDASENEEGVQTMIPHAVRILSSQINSLHHYRMARILEVRKKIVSGVIYQMKMEMERTKCKKNEVQVNDITDCELDQSAPLEVCTVELWWQRWISEEPRLQKSSCKTQEKKEVLNK